MYTRNRITTATACCLLGLLIGHPTSVKIRVVVGFRYHDSSSCCSSRVHRRFGTTTFRSGRQQGITFLSHVNKRSMTSCSNDNSNNNNENDNHLDDNQRKIINSSIPLGRVEDRDEWIRLCSESLRKATGKTLYQEISERAQASLSSSSTMNSTSTTTPPQCPADIHDHERFAILSHGTQDDPIYKYFNKAALLTFQYPESEIYSLPSRYSAPSGSVREQRQQLMKQVDIQQVQIFPTAIRQTKFGDLFQLQQVILWNVYDNNNDNHPVGQTALFDRQQIISPPPPPPDAAAAVAIDPPRLQDMIKNGDE